jgi:short-subunit dehydrogenase involved in D-alanine esterification of teichoic acids
MKLKGERPVTGGSKGMGKESQPRSSGKSASVIICGRNEINRLLVTARQARANKYIVADIANRDDIGVLAKSLGDKWGSLDVLVNNASILGEHGQSPCIRKTFGRK